MFGIFIFPSNSSDKEYSCRKDPKKPLKMTDDELVHFVRITPKMTYFCHYRDDYDTSSVEEKFSVIEKYIDKQYLPLKKLRGIEDAYQTEDGEYYVKVITKNKEWFMHFFV